MNIINWYFLASARLTAILIIWEQSLAGETVYCLDGILDVSSSSASFDTGLILNLES